VAAVRERTSDTISMLTNSMQGLATELQATHVREAALQVRAEPLAYHATMVVPCRPLDRVIKVAP
jgi:hypothetical protein